MRIMMSGKIHRATITGANVNYEGSITIDPNLLDAAGILPYEQVHVLDVSNGARLETYAILGERGSGDVCVNGAAARLVREGDLAIVVAYQHLTEDEARHLRPRVVFVDGRNRPVETSLGNGRSHTAPQDLALVAGVPG